MIERGEDLGGGGWVGGRKRVDWAVYVYVRETVVPVLIAPKRLFYFVMIERQDLLSVLREVHGDDARKV